MTHLLLCAALIIAPAFADKDTKVKKITTTTTTNPTTPTGAQQTTGTQQTLYDRLGGRETIATIVDDFTTRAAADPKVNFMREGKVSETRQAEFDVEDFKSKMVEYMTSATGGPSEYKGADMKTAHKGMKISEAEFNALAMDFAATLDAHSIQKKEKDELMKLVAANKKDIVEVKR
jgi:hemoglobin